MTETIFGLPDLLWLLVSLSVLGVWLKRTRWGQTALLDSALRDWNSRLWSLVGRGGSAKKMAAALPFYAICFLGMTFGILALTVLICTLFGYETIQRHDTLTQIKNAKDAGEIVSLCFKAAVIAPLTEEFFYRGFMFNCLVYILIRLQQPFTIIRSTGDALEPSRPPAPYHQSIAWTAIVCTALLFAISHKDQQHWPALIFLGGALGYSYQKQGNILMPILIHAIFNGTVLAVNIFFPPGLNSQG